jgi:hypothetical protein
MCYSTADSHTVHIVIAARYLHSWNLPQCGNACRHHLVLDLLRLTLVFTWNCCARRLCHPCSLILSLSPLSPLSLILDDPSVLALRLPPASYSSLEVMYTAMLATIYMCSQHGISLQLSCKPAERSHPTCRTWCCAPSHQHCPFDLWR